VKDDDDDKNNSTKTKKKIHKTSSIALDHRAYSRKKIPQILKRARKHEKRRDDENEELLVFVSDFIAGYGREVGEPGGGSPLLNLLRAFSDEFFRFAGEGA
jgi:hypothetical protein